MRVLRAFGGVVVGYLIYAISSMLLVGGVMERQGLMVIVLGCVALAAIGGLAGFVASMIAAGTSRVVGLILAGLVAAATLANLLMHLGAEPTWYKLGTLFLTVPAILVASLRTSSNDTGD